MNLTGILLLLAGIIGVTPIDTRLAWLLVGIAGLLMLI